MTILAILIFLGLGGIATAILFEDDSIDALDAAFLAALGAIILSVYDMLLSVYERIPSPTIHP